MIIGIVEPSGDATVTVKLRGPTGITSEALTVIDTGFNDYLTLPLPTVEHLQLPPMEEVRYSLADGSETIARLYSAELEWHDGWRSILVVAMNGTPLLGMATLRRLSLLINVIDGGRVEIHPIGN